MTKILLPVFLSALAIFFSSCKQATSPGDECVADNSAQHQQSADCPATPVEPDPAPEDPVDPLPDTGADVPPEASLFKTNTKFTNFSAADQEKVQKALTIIKSVIRTSEFRDRVINFAYQGQNKYVDSNRSPEDIYQSLLDGSEKLSPGVDHEMDLDLELYYSLTSTVGYTYPDVNKIWMNTKYFNSYTPAEVAGNIFHEWTHKLGYDHAASYSVSRDSSVPYALGYLMEELGAEFEH